MFVVIKTIPINCNPREFAREQKNMDDGYHQWHLQSMSKFWSDFKSLIDVFKML